MEFPLDSRLQGTLGLTSHENSAVAPLASEDEEGACVERRHHRRRSGERRGAYHLDALETRDGVERRQHIRRQADQGSGSTN